MRKHFSILLFLLLISAFVKAKVQTQAFNHIPERCDVGFDFYPFVKIGLKYYFIDQVNRVNWFDAAHICRQHNAELATITNEIELNALSNHLLGDHHEAWKKYWLSGNDLDAEGTYYWLGSGNKINYTKWGPNNPNNRNGNENCINFYTWQSEHQYYMNDAYCWESNFFICEAMNMRMLNFAFW